MVAEGAAEPPFADDTAHDQEISACAVMDAMVAAEDRRVVDATHDEDRVVRDATHDATHFQAKSIKCLSGDLCPLLGGFFMWTAEAQAYSAATYGPGKTAPVRCHDCRKNRNLLQNSVRRGPH